MRVRVPLKYSRHLIRITCGLQVYYIHSVLQLEICPTGEPLLPLQSLRSGLNRVRAHSFPSGSHGSRERSLLQLPTPETDSKECSGGGSEVGEQEVVGEGAKDEVRATPSAPMTKWATTCNDECLFFRVWVESSLRHLFPNVSAMCLTVKDFDIIDSTPAMSWVHEMGREKNLTIM